MEKYYLFALSVHDTRTLKGDRVGNVIYTIERNEDLAKKKALLVSYGEYQRQFIEFIKIEILKEVNSTMDMFTNQVNDLIYEHKSKTM
jgi:hypothetical protein